MSPTIYPVREQLRSEILSALASGAAMTTVELYDLCSSATNTDEISRVAYELRKKGLIVSEKTPHPRGLPANAYRLPHPQPQTEPTMSEEPAPYITGPDAFGLEPSDPEAQPDVDSELIDLLEEYVGDVGDEQDRQPCHCTKISLPTLPKGYSYGGIKVWIENEHDLGRMTIATHDEGGGAFASIKASGRLSFDPGDLVKIGQVADALIRLHESMSKQNND